MRKDYSKLKYCYSNIDEFRELYFSAIKGDDTLCWQVLDNLISLPDRHYQLFIDTRPFFHLVPDKPNSDKVSLLSLLAFYGHHHIIQKLPEKLNLSKKQYQHLLAWDQYNAFYWACVKGHKETVILLHKQCDSKDQQKMIKASDKDRPYRAFADAARYNLVDIQKLLIELCSSKSLQQLIKADGCIAFSCACAYGNLEMIELIWSICDPKYRETMLASSSDTPIKWALDCCNSNSKIPIRYLRYRDGVFHSDLRFPKKSAVVKLLKLYNDKHLKKIVTTLAFPILDILKDNAALYNKLMNTYLDIWEQGAVKFHYLKMLAHYAQDDATLCGRVERLCPENLTISPREFTPEILASVANLLKRPYGPQKLSLYSFSVNNIDPLMHAIKEKCTSVKELVLFGYSSTENLKNIFQSLQNNTTITTLIISQHDITESSLLSLRELVSANNTINKLQLSSSYIKDSHVLHIAETLSSPSSITELVFRDTDITDTGIAHLIKMLDTNKQITRLDLKYNKKISDSGYKALEKAVLLGNYKVILSEPKLFLYKLFKESDQFTTETEIKQTLHI